jgi:parallel beta-helix repeat protein
VFGCGLRPLQQLRCQSNHKTSSLFPKICIIKYLLINFYEKKSLGQVLGNIIVILLSESIKIPFVFHRSYTKLMLHLEFSPNRRLDMLSTKLICSQLARLSVFPTSILSLSIALGVASIALLDTTFSSAIAQITIRTEQNLHSERTISQVNLLFVNPSIGNDQGGNGSEIAPFQTITQALQAAQPNTVIMLSPGTYSPNTGEVFPLILKQGVAIQGDTDNKGRSVQITGGGEYLSRSFGSQNVAIVGANQAGLSGVTVTNTNSRGYGLWIESSNPLIQENTFTGNTQDGISITGNATATISKNYFNGNGANGITISGDSRPQVRENIFQRTGFGINIAQNAAPEIIANQIQDNRSGIIVQANTSPILRNNIIQGSKEDGLVVIAQATPDLGSAQQPGGNQFRNNGRYDINAKAAKQVISAAGNNLVRNRIIGNVDINGRTVAIIRNSAPNYVSAPEIPTNPQIVFAAPSIPKTFNQSTVVLSNRSNTPQNSQLLPTNFQPSTVELPLDTPQLNYVRIEPGVIEFTAPQASLPNNSVTISTPNGYATTSRSVRYRVIVPVTNNQQREVVLSVAPDAFSKIWQGSRVMQVGVFSSQDTASEMVQILSSKGLRAYMEPLN